MTQNTASATHGPTDTWELGGEIIAAGFNHPSLAAVSEEWKRLLSSVVVAQERSRCLKRAGAGRTEDPTLILAEIVPALLELAAVAQLVADQLSERLDASGP